MDVYPLLLPEIVEQVFHKLSLRSLITCRLVCRLWNHVAKRVKLKWIPIKIMRVEDIDKVLHAISMNSALKIAKMTIAYRNLKHPGFNILLSHIGFSLTTLLIGDEVVKMTNFCKILKQLPHLTRLEVGNLRGAGRIFPIYDYDVVPPKMMVFDKIKTLSFNSIRIIAPLVSAFKSFPKLKIIRAMDYIVENFKPSTTISVPDLQKIFMMCNLEYGFGNQHLEIFRKMEINSLECLSIKNFRRDMNVRLFKVFVETQKNTLKSLALLHSPDSNFKRFPLYFPINLPNLTYLTISKEFARNLSLVCSKLPNLRYINFHFKPGSNWLEIFPINIQARTTVTGCTIRGIDSTALYLLSSMFPSITNLTIKSCTDEILFGIYSNFQNLENLSLQYIKNSELNQETFTGITEDVLTSLFGNKKFQGKTLDKLRFFPGIRCLKKLKHVVLHFVETISPSNMLLYGILHCRCLKTVSLENVKLSENFFQTLKDNFKLQICKYIPGRIANGDSYYIISGDRYSALADRSTYKIVP